MQNLIMYVPSKRESGWKLEQYMATGEDLWAEKRVNWRDLPDGYQLPTGFDVILLSQSDCYYYLVSEV